MITTVDKLAEMTNTDPARTYGLLRFLEAAGLIKAENEATGKKGKPRRIYHVDQETWSNLANFLTACTDEDVETGLVEDTDTVVEQLTADSVPL